MPKVLSSLTVFIAVILTLVPVSGFAADVLTVTQYDQKASSLMTRNISGKCTAGLSIVAKGSGLSSYSFATCPAAGSWGMTLKLTSGLGNKNVVIRAGTAAVTLNLILASDEALELVPSYDALTGANEKYGYVESLIVGIGAPVNYQVGRIPIVKADNPTSLHYAMSGATSGLSINASTGMISVSNSSLLTVGTRLITVTVEGLYISKSTRVQIRIVNDASGIRFVDAVAGNDANSGKLPHVAKKTLAGAGGGTSVKLALKRGGAYSGHVVMFPGMSVESYGDPLLAAPKIVVPTTMSFGIEPAKNASKGTYMTNLTNILIKDIQISGGIRSIYLNGGTNLKILRVRAGDNVNSANSQGIYVRAFNGDVALRHNQLENIYGDGIYLVKVNGSTAPVELAYNELGIPKDWSADNIQVANEGDASQRSSNVWVHHNILHQSIDSSSTKGALVIEGIDRWLIENNKVEGKYFGIAIGGPTGVVRNNDVTGARLPTSNSNYPNATGIMMGGNLVAYGVQIYDNKITNSYNGFAISGYNDPSTGFQRYDLEIHNNTISGCSVAAKVDRAWSGFMMFNIGHGNTNNSLLIKGNGLKIATGGSYSTQTKAPNFFQTSAGPAFTESPKISGSFKDGGTLMATTGNAGADVDYEFQWRINGVPVSGANKASFVIPVGTAARTQSLMPNVGGLNKAEISVVVKAVDANGLASTSLGLYGNKPYAQMP